MSQQLQVEQRQKSWGGQSNSNISRQIKIKTNADIPSIKHNLNSAIGNEKLSSFGEVILEDLGLDDRLSPHFFGTKYN